MKRYSIFYLAGVAVIVAVGLGVYTGFLFGRGSRLQSTIDRSANTRRIEGRSLRTKNPTTSYEVAGSPTAIQSSDNTASVNDVWRTFQNTQVGFSIDLPQGHELRGLQVIPIKPSGQEEPPDFTIAVSSGTIKADFYVNGLRARKFSRACGEGGSSTVYELGAQGKIYRFAEWECLEFKDFKRAVNSFRLISID